MAQADSNFVALVAEAFALPTPEASENRVAFKIHDHDIELSFDSTGRLVTFVGLAHVRVSDARLNAQLIADFNCNYLFNGGYALVVVEDARLCLCRTCRMAGVEPRRLRPLIEDFIGRTESAAIWYRNRLRKAESIASRDGVEGPGTVFRA